MKCNQSFLTHLMVCCLFMATAALGAGIKKLPSFSPAGIYHLASVYNNTDTVPKAGASKTIKSLEKAAKDAMPKVKVPKVEVPKADGNLFKKIADLFKFRKNAQASEKKRVLDIFESLGVTDSIAASAENIKTLIDELSIRENQHFDALMSIIDTIKARKPTVIFVKDSTAKDKDKDEKVVAEPSSAKVVTDKDIEDLTNKLLPLIADKSAESEKDKDKQIKLAAIQNVLTGTDQREMLVDSAKGTIKIFRLKLKYKAEVYGIYNYGGEGNFEDYKLGSITTLLYNSLFVNGRTGNYKPDLNGWQTSNVITAALQAKCRVVLTASIQQPLSTEAFLQNKNAQEAFITNTISLLNDRKGKGVNIQFDGVHIGNRPSFTSFIQNLSAKLRKADSTFRVYITVPALENIDGYDFKALNTSVSRFMLNFSNVDKSLFGPMAPLKGKRSIDAVVSRIQNEKIAPHKLIVSVSYQGTFWQVKPGKPGGTFIQTYTYAEILNKFDTKSVYYDDESASGVIDILNKNQQAIRTLFYDDATSLEKKYDYILNSSLGGVCIDALGYDKGSADLWKALSYKFSAIDTVIIKDSMMGKPVNTDLNIFQRASRYLTLFGYVLNNPCEMCFDNIQDTAYAEKIYRDLAELNVDSVIIEKNKTLPIKDKYRSRFGFINHELTKTLGYLSIFLLLFTLICGGVYLYKIKMESEEWEWKKKAEIILIGLCVLLVLSLFTYLFSSDSIGIFGATPKAMSTGDVSFSKGLAKAMVSADAVDSTAVVTISDDNSTACVPDPNDECINMPFSTLMIIIFVGMLVGVLITRYLIMPLLQRNDIP